MLNKFIALTLALGVINTNSLPLTFNSIAINEIKKANDSLALEEMANGDYSAEGKGSVTEELTLEGITNLSYYDAGFYSNDKMLMVAENNSAIYLYTYDTKARTTFDKVSISIENNFTSTSGNINYKPNFITKDIRLVSTSKNHYLNKWEVLDFKPDLTTNHVYEVRELYIDSKKDTSDGILSTPILYQWDANQQEKYQEYTDVVTITSKVVAWQNFANGKANSGYLNDGLSINQLHYVAFNTDRDNEMDRLTKIELEYDYQYFYGLMDIQSGSELDANDITNVNYWNKRTANTSVVTPAPSNHVRKEIANEKNTYSSYGVNFFFFKTDYKEWNIDTLTTLEQLKANNPDREVISNSNVNDKKWFCNFDKTTFSYGVPYHTELAGLVSINKPFNDKRYIFGLNNYDLTNKSSGGELLKASSDTEEKLEQTYKSYTSVTSGNYSSSKSPTYISNLSILRLYWEYQGKPMQATVIDTYNDSAGTANIFDPHVITFTEWWSNVMGWFNSNWQWLVAVIVGVICLPILISILVSVPGLLANILKLLKYLLKGILWLISAPFKLLIWLFKPRDK